MQRLVTHTRYKYTNHDIIISLTLNLNITATNSSIPVFYSTVRT